MPRLSAEQWLEIETAYRAGRSTKELAENYGCHESAIKQKAKKGNWVREPGEVKRRLVEAKLSAPSVLTVPSEERGQAVREGVRSVLEIEATADAAVLSEAAAGFVDAIRAARSLLKPLDLGGGETAPHHPTAVKDATTALKTATAGYKDVRGLNEKPPEESDFESAVRRLRDQGEV